jgi:hypothetical protein
MRASTSSINTLCTEKPRVSSRNGAPIVVELAWERMVGSKVHDVRVYRTNELCAPFAIVDQNVRQPVLTRCTHCEH